MPVAITVGPPAITINQGNTFMVTNLRGEIDPYKEHGVFARDTRFISAYRLTINQAPWTLLSSSAITYHSAGFEFVNPTLQTEDGELVERSIGMSVAREIAQAVDETLTIANYGLHPARFFLELLLRSDFADIFEVRTKQIVRRGRTITEWDAARRRLTTSYVHRDFQRSCRLEVRASDSVPLYANGRLSYEIALDPGQRWQASHAIHLIAEGSLAAEQQPPTEQRAQADVLQADWHTLATSLISSNEDVYRAYRQSIEDMGALRMEDGDGSPYTWVPAAGIPWYATVFGRDSLIVALQTMAVNPGLGVGTLHTLARLQAAATDDWRDAQPGKMPHEIRFGELAHFGKVPHTPYFAAWNGSIAMATWMAMASRNT